jgi:hypothetical protein
MWPLSLIEVIEFFANSITSVLPVDHLCTTAVLLPYHVRTTVLALYDLCSLLSQYTLHSALHHFHLCTISALPQHFLWTTSVLPLFLCAKSVIRKLLFYYLCTWLYLLCTFSLLSRTKFVFALYNLWVCLYYFYYLYYTCFTNFVCT